MHSICLHILLHLQIQELVDNSHKSDSVSQTPPGHSSNQSSIKKNDNSQTDLPASTGLTVGSKESDNVQFTFTPSDPATGHLLENLKEMRSAPNEENDDKGIGVKDRGVEFELPEDEREHAKDHSDRLKR